MKYGVGVTLSRKPEFRENCVLDNRQVEVPGKGYEGPERE
jgi:hypothetical protein